MKSLLASLGMALALGLSPAIRKLDAGEVEVAIKVNAGRVVLAGNKGGGHPDGADGHRVARPMRSPGRGLRAGR